MAGSLGFPSVEPVIPNFSGRDQLVLRKILAERGAQIGAAGSSVQARVPQAPSVCLRHAAYASWSIALSRSIFPHALNLPLPVPVSRTASAISYPHTAQEGVNRRLAGIGGSMLVPEDSRPAINGYFSVLSHSLPGSHRGLPLVRQWSDVTSD